MHQRHIAYRIVHKPHGTAGFRYWTGYAWSADPKRAMTFPFMTSAVIEQERYSMSYVFTYVERVPDDKS